MGDEVIPVLQFNQQTINEPTPAYREYACAPTSVCICASAFNLVDSNTFQVKVGQSITQMKTMIGSGTAPQNMMAGVPKVYSGWELTTRKFSWDKIVECIEHKKPMVINLLTDKNFGYKGRFPHYVAVTGANKEKNRVGISDPHGFNVGHPTRYFVDYAKVKAAVDNNGGRPIYVFERR